MATLAKKVDGYDNSLLKGGGTIFAGVLKVLCDKELETIRIKPAPQLFVTTPLL